MAYNLPAPAIQFKQINMSSAAFKTSNSVPVQIIAAPGSGKIIMVLGWILKLNYGGTNAFVGVGLPSLKYASSGTIISAGVASAYTGTTNKNYSYSLFTAATGTIENDALNYITQTADPTGNAAANNTVSVGVWYNIVSIT